MRATSENKFNVKIGGRFSLIIENVPIATFNEVTTPDISTDRVEFRIGMTKDFLRKQQGLVKHGIVVLKQGITDSCELYEWCKKAIQGEVQTGRKDFSISMKDNEGKELAKWDCIRGLPISLDAPVLKAQGSIAIEKLEIAIEGIERNF
jgi:phage tail-like protein